MSCALPEASGPNGVLTRPRPRSLEASSGPFTSHTVKGYLSLLHNEQGGGWQNPSKEGGLCFETSTPNFQFWRAAGRVGRGLGALGGNFRTPRGPGPAGSLETSEGTPAQPEPSLPPPSPSPGGQGGPGTQGGGGVPGSLPKVQQQLGEAGLDQQGRAPCLVL